MCSVRERRQAGAEAAGAAERGEKFFVFSLRVADPKKKGKRFSTLTSFIIILSSKIKTFPQLSPSESQRDAPRAFPTARSKSSSSARSRLRSPRRSGRGSGCLSKRSAASAAAAATATTTVPLPRRKRRRQRRPRRKRADEVFFALSVTFSAMKCMHLILSI